MQHNICDNKAAGNQRQSKCCITLKFCDKCIFKPIIPKARRSEFDNGQNDRIYAILLVLQLMLQRIWTNNNWAEGLRELVNAHPKIPYGSMGMPQSWVLRKEWRF
jgi:abortive infection bacteriophage resistance protein